MQLFCDYCLYYHLVRHRMTSMKHHKAIQIRIRNTTHRQIKMTAIHNGMTTSEFILRTLLKSEDKKLVKLIETELKYRPKPGMPQTSRAYLKLFMKHLLPKLKTRRDN